MDGIKTYLLRLTAAALVCGIATGIAKGKKLPGSLIKLLCGVLMALVLLSPLMGISGTDLLALTGDYTDAANDAADMGKNAAALAWVDGIKTATEAYILDKADLYDASIAVEVTVRAGQPPVPGSVRISGRISPYGKKMLTEEIAQMLGIAEEDQVWTQ